MAESHVATGETSDLMNKDMMDYLEKLFCKQRPDDVELKKLLGWRQYSYAHLAISRGERDEALHYLNQARRNFPALWRSTMLYYAVKLARQASFLQKTYNTSYALNYALGQIRRNELSVGALAQKLARRFSAVLHLGIGFYALSADYLLSSDLMVWLDIG